MFQTEKHMHHFDAISKTTGGQFFGVLGHKSKSDGSVKTRLLQATTGAITRGIDLEAQRLDGMTALTVAHLLKPHGIPATLASEALTVLVDRVKARQNGASQGGAKVKHIVARGKNGRAIMQIVSVRDSWALQVVGEQVDSWLTLDGKGDPVNAGNIDHAADKARKLTKSVEQAQKQAEKRKGNPAQSISSIVALLNKVIPSPADQPQYRTLTLMGPGASNVDSVAINGERFTDFVSIVAHFRPDLVQLMQKA
jgi:hypothetical protein